MKPHLRARWAIAGLSVSLLLGALASPPAVAQSSLDDIRKRGELVIATDATYPPFEYMDGKKTGGAEKPKGFDIDVGDAIGREIGVPVRWTVLEWGSVLASLETRK